MATVEVVAWIIFAAVIGLTLLFSIAFAKYFEDKRDKEMLVTVVVIGAMLVCLCTVALLPVDIALVSSTNDPHTGLRRDWASQEKVNSIIAGIKGVYYASYSLVVAFCFVVIPWAYFYYEEFEEDQTRRGRIFSASQYTAFTLLIAVVLLVIGIFYRPHRDNTSIDLDWFKNLIGETSGEHAISFVIATLIALGMVTFIVYTGPGLAVLPIGMIKGRYFASADDHESVMAELTLNREKQRTIEAKYTGSMEPMTRRDQRALEDLQKQERILTRRSRTIEEQRASWWTKALKILRPFQLFIGILLLALSTAIFVSMFLTLVDKIANSVCGKDCGYILSNPNLFNPINLAFNGLARIFPLDYIFFLLLVIYFFFSTLCGIVAIGIRVLWVNLYKVRKAATVPQGMLATTLLLMVSLLALNYTLTMVVAPSYLHFGNQRFCNLTMNGLRDCTDHPEAILPCDSHSPGSVCTPSVVSLLLDRITYNNRFFGIVYYWSQWVMMAVFLISSVFALFKSRSMDGFLASNGGEESDDDELLDEEEGLLGGFRRRLGNTFDELREGVARRSERNARTSVGT